jgi:hypothetical protein
LLGIHAIEDRSIGRLGQAMSARNSKRSRKA